MKRKVIVIPLIISTVLILGAAAASFASGADFKDVKTTNWAYPAIQDMVSREIVTGYPDGTFQPNNIVTYGEFIKMAVAASGEDPGASTAAGTHWAQSYYDAAISKKFFTIGDIPKEALNQPIPRRYMAVIIGGILGDVKIANYSELEKKISDVDSTTKFEYAIMKAYGSGILSGYPDGTFRPDDTLSRAEAASVIQRLVDENKRVLPDGTAGKPKETTEPAVTTKEAVSGEYDGFRGECGLSADGKTYIPPSSEGLVIPVAKSGPITDMISDPERLNKKLSSDVPKTKYVLAASTEPFDFRIQKMAIGDGIFAKGKGLSRVIFIKDGKMIWYGGGLTNPDDWHYTEFDFNDVETERNKIGFVKNIDEIPDFDYLASFDSSSTGGEYLLVIPNPWK